MHPLHHIHRPQAKPRPIKIIVALSPLADGQQLLPRQLALAYGTGKSWMMQGKAWEYAPIEAQRFLCLKDLSSDRIALEDSAIADDEHTNRVRMRRVGSRTDIPGRDIVHSDTPVDTHGIEGKMVGQGMTVRQESHLSRLIHDHEIRWQYHSLGGKEARQEIIAGADHHEPLPLGVELVKRGIGVG